MGENARAGLGSLLVAGVAGAVLAWMVHAGWVFLGLSGWLMLAVAAVGALSGISGIGLLLMAAGAHLRSNVTVNVSVSTGVWWRKHPAWALFTALAVLLAVSVLLWPHAPAWLAVVLFAGVAATVTGLVCVALGSVSGDSWS